MRLRPATRGGEPDRDPDGVPSKHAIKAAHERRRLCKVYGRLIGYPMLKPHDLRHGVALEVLEQHHDLEEVRALLGHARIDTTQVYTTIRPPQLKRAVAFYEEKAEQMPRTSRTRGGGFEKQLNVARTRNEKLQPIHRGGPNGIRTRVWSRSRFCQQYREVLGMTTHRKMT